MKIRTATSDDGLAIAEIYNHYIKTSHCTFEEELVDQEIMAARIRKVEGANLPWIVGEEDGVVIGYAYAGPWKLRSGYRFTVESSIYIKHDFHSKGIGYLLYAHLFDLLKSKGILNVIGGIGLPNPASVRLHEKFGFKKVAEFEEVGIKFGIWTSVSYWQLRLNSFNQVNKL